MEAVYSQSLRMKLLQTLTDNLSQVPEARARPSGLPWWCQTGNEGQVTACSWSWPRRKQLLHQKMQARVLGRGRAGGLEPVLSSLSSAILGRENPDSGSHGY